MFDVICVTGPRDARCSIWEIPVRTFIARNLKLAGLLMHGGATGIDSIAEESTAGMDRDVKVYHADWGRPLDRSAGPRRNREMIAALHGHEQAGLRVAVFAFHDDLGPHLKGSGTFDMASATRKAGITLWAINSKGEVKKYEGGL